MSLYGMMRTSVSGMAAQVNRLSTTADNIANSGTTGYKKSRAEFATLVLAEAPGYYNSGAVSTAIQTAVSAQGVLQSTSSVTDLAVNGNGFFVVQNPAGTPFLTRAGAFVPDKDGNLVNAAGFKLMAYSLTEGAPAVTANGFEGLVPVSFSSGVLSASASTAGTFKANLPANATAVAAANRPSANAATASYSQKSSVIAYDNVGAKVTLDVYSTKTGPNTWEIAVFDKSTATTDAGFPYSAGPLATQTLSFDPANGTLAAASATAIAIPVPDGKTLTLDFAGTTQLASTYTVEAQVNGTAPGNLNDMQIGKDGTIYAQNSSGTLQALYRIPLATVTSPDQMLKLKGTIYSPGPDSGPVRIGFPEENAFGSVASGSLENSTVDVAEELTTMIESQRSYTANSKVFQTGSELSDIIINLKR